MQVGLFLDTLTLATNQFETVAINILINPKRTSTKIELLTHELLSLKYEVLHSISTLFKSLSLTTPLREALQANVTQTQDRLYKYRLHLLLKTKIDQIKKESMIQTHIGSGQSPPILSKLQESVLMIESNLGIERVEDSRGISNIINRSLMSLEETPIRAKQESFSVDLKCGDNSMEMSQAFPNKPLEPPKSPVLKKKRKMVSGVNGVTSPTLDNLLEESYQVCLD